MKKILVTWTGDAGTLKIGQDLFVTKFQNLDRIYEFSARDVVGMVKVEELPADDTKFVFLHTFDTDEHARDTLSLWNSELSDEYWVDQEGYNAYVRDHHISRSMELVA